MNVFKYMEFGFDTFLYGIQEFYIVDIVVIFSQIFMILNNIKVNMSYKLIMYIIIVFVL